MVTVTTTLRQATAGDLSAINELIDAAILTWKLPERVKRLSMSSYHYHLHDLETLEIVIAENSEQHIVGVAAWEPANPSDAPTGQTTLLLHGIYVTPQQYRHGIGRQLLQAAERAARENGYAALLVKAQPDAAGFFQAQGMLPLEVENEQRDYPHRYWKLIE